MPGTLRFRSATNVSSSAPSGQTLHNALNKVVGAAVRVGSPPLAGTVLVVSARASFEIVHKASVAGIPVVVAVGAPTSLAVELAGARGITLVAFTRHPSMSVYTRLDGLTG